MAEDTEQIYRLRDEVDVQTQLFRRAAEGPMPTAHTDASGSITVELDGERPPHVQITDAWRSAYDPDVLGQAVVRAFQDLAVARAAEWGQHVDAAGESTYRPSPTPPLHDSFAARLQQQIEADPDQGVAMTQVLQNVLDVFDDLAENIDETFSTLFARGSAGGPVHGTREVEVQVTANGDPASVVFDEDWLRTASAATITREVNLQLADAHAQAGSSTASALAGTPLARYQEFADDPEAFLRFLTGKD
ncbi:hypothetical protein [Microbacterium luticocti]|uniref:hypothetical protein n=1 Tax=Microbacterium luticocti TaxID=451764 RepID=UPI0004182F25|nr:hypothetical protein [Microbacterium luticocti]